MQELLPSTPPLIALAVGLGMQTILGQPAQGVVVAQGDHLQEEEEEEEE